LLQALKSLDFRAFSYAENNLLTTILTTTSPNRALFYCLKWSDRALDQGLHLVSGVAVHGVGDVGVTKYDSSIGGCYVCGHTKNQNTQKKVLNVDKNPYAYCYRMKTKLGGDGSEKEIDLTPGASKAI
jgi:hypothetical protein